MRIEQHPILTFPAGKMVKFTFDGKELYGKEGEPIVAALHANGIKVIGHSHNKHRPRGLYCAIGNCSSCLATVNGEPNVRTCITPLCEGMVVTMQNGKGVIK
ncbi:MAG: (2Fe-2S)-binding protein [Clostridia bacterium]|nr:(2Fe-2S)-binding protein [Clostridia bacterium]